MLGSYEQSGLFAHKVQSACKLEKRAKITLHDDHKYIPLPSGETCVFGAPQCQLLTYSWLYLFEGQGYHRKTSSSKNSKGHTELPHANK